MKLTLYDNALIRQRVAVVYIKVSWEVRQNKSLSENGERAIARWVAKGKGRVRKKRDVPSGDVHPEGFSKYMNIYLGTREKFTSHFPRRLSIQLQSSRAVRCRRVSTYELRRRQRDARRGLTRADPTFKRQSRANESSYPVPAHLSAQSG